VDISLLYARITWPGPVFRISAQHIPAKFCPGHMVWSCNLPLHLTPILRSDAAISLLHLYAWVPFTATTKPDLNAFPSGLVSRHVCYSLHRRRVTYFDIFLHDIRHMRLSAVLAHLSHLDYWHPDEAWLGLKLHTTPYSIFLE